MANIKVAINGLGRIGRTVLREYFNRNINNIEIVAVNNPGDKGHYAHLFKYDSVHGPFQGTVKLENDNLHINDRKIAFLNTMDPAELPWKDLGVDLVIDSTGVFKDKEGLGRHIKAGAKKVIMCAPGKDLDATFVMGINDSLYDHQNHHIISNASCTTNCLAPVAKVLNDSFGIDKGFMTTIHAYTLDQHILDSSHPDLRRARAGALSMIPTTTGAAKAVGLVIPELKGKLDGYAVRVPTPDVSMVDLTVTLKKSATKEEVNQAILEASNSTLKGILAYSDEPLVSIDFMGRRESSIFDSALTNVIEDTVKVVSWYDNEVGFSNRVIDLATLVGSKY